MTEWITRPRSRRLRKLYAALDQLEQTIETVRSAVYWPDHAPTDFQIRCSRLRPLLTARFELWQRISALQNDSDY